MRNEGPRCRAARLGMQHGGFHFHEAPAFQEGTDGGDDLAALAEGIPHFGIDHHVQIPLTIAQVHVRQAVEFFRQGFQALGQQRNIFRMDGNFPRLGLEHLALHAHNVADVHFLESGVHILAHVVPADIKLHVAVGVQQLGERRLPHDVPGHDASGQGHCLAFISVIIVPDLAALSVHIGFGEQIRIVSAFPQGGQLVTANLFLFGIGGCVLFLRHLIKTSLRW